MFCSSSDRRSSNWTATVATAYWTARSTHSRLLDIAGRFDYRQFLPSASRISNRLSSAPIDKNYNDLYHRSKFARKRKQNGARLEQWFVTTRVRLTTGIISSLISHRQFLTSIKKIIDIINGFFAESLSVTCPSRPYTTFVCGHKILRWLQLRHLQPPVSQWIVMVRNLTIRHSLGVYLQSAHDIFETEPAWKHALFAYSTFPISYLFVYIIHILSIQIYLLSLLIYI